MTNGTPKISVEELLAKEKKPAEDAMVLHPFYRGKIETVLKCCVRTFQDFAIPLHSLTSLNVCSSFLLITAEGDTLQALRLFTVFGG